MNIDAPRDFAPRVSGGRLSLSNCYQLGEHYDPESIENVNTITHTIHLSSSSGLKVSTARNIASIDLADSPQRNFISGSTIACFYSKLKNPSKGIATR